MRALLEKAIKKVVPLSVYSPIRKALRYIGSYRYIGRTYECPFCRGHFSMFLPSGLDIAVLKEKQVVSSGYRLNSMCPRCYSSDRERLIFLYLEKYQPHVFLKKVKLLHVAPERNLAITFKSNANISYVSADLDSDLADIQMDITDIKQQNDTYDVIVCNHVLEHIPDDAKAMRELFRVLKTGGVSILQVPISYSIETTFEDPSITSPEDRALLFGQKDHVRIYGKDYISRLKKAGFSVTEHYFTEDLGPKDIIKFGLLKEERIFVCSKP